MISQGKSKVILLWAMFLKETRYIVTGRQDRMDRLGHKYDCMLKGNFGKNGENEVISYISRDPKVVVIFQKDYTKQKQQTKITEYVKTNLNYQESVGKKYLVYSHKKVNSINPLKKEVDVSPPLFLN